VLDADDEIRAGATSPSPRKILATTQAEALSVPATPDLARRSPRDETSNWISDAGFRYVWSHSREDPLDPACRFMHTLAADMRDIPPNSSPERTAGTSVLRG